MGNRDKYTKGELYRGKWGSDLYKENCAYVANAINQYMNRPIKRILDIGCGYAYTSTILQQQHNCEVWLVEGDPSTNKVDERFNGYGPVESMQFYSDITTLKEQWNSQGLTYRFVDANNIDIPQNIKFDLVTSHLSCGYHYPVSTYADLILQHQTEDCVVAMNVRRKTYDRCTDADRWRPRERILHLGKHSFVDMEII